jgi:hypothetical protein
MFDDLSLPLKFFIAFLIVLGLIGVTAWIVRRFGADRLGGNAARGRQPRLAVIDAASVDGRRRLVLIRRDNVEHLLMIGGPSDVVIEPNIVRAAAAAPREAPPPARPAPPADTLPRAVPLGEGNMWPLQPEPAPAARAAPRAPAPPVPEEPMHWQVEPEAPAPAPPPRPARAPDPLVGLAAELSTRPPAPASTPQRAPRAAKAQPAVPAAATNEPFTSAADQNLAEMAQRLEAALRRPGAANEPPPAATAPQHEVTPEPDHRGAPAAPDAAAAPPPRAAAPAPTDAKPARKPAASKSLYDSLEQEMASLLGRPNGKT